MLKPSPSLCELLRAIFIPGMASGPPVRRLNIESNCPWTAVFWAGEQPTVTLNRIEFPVSAERSGSRVTETTMPAAFSRCRANLAPIISLMSVSRSLGP